MIAALFVDPKGCYTTMAGVDPWPESRDARLYDGPWPIVAHPPCAAWGRLAGFRQACHGYPVGEDGGCFSAALGAIRTYGGIIEHPAFSKAWPAFNLTKPDYTGWKYCGDNEWTCYVEQGRYGHVHKKATWLYVVSTHKPIELRWGRINDQKSGNRTRWKGSIKLTSQAYHKRSARKNSATPIPFRDLLIEIAKRSNQ